MKIVKVKKDSYGDIQQVMFDNGLGASVDKAIKMAAKSQIEGVNVGRARNGRQTLRSNPDGDSQNNLMNLPTFE